MGSLAAFPVDCPVSFCHAHIGYTSHQPHISATLEPKFRNPKLGAQSIWVRSERQVFAGHGVRWTRGAGTARGLRAGVGEGKKLGIFPCSAPTLLGHKTDDLVQHAAPLCHESRYLGSGAHLPPQPPQPPMHYWNRAFVIQSEEDGPRSLARFSGGRQPLCRRAV